MECDGRSIPQNRPQMEMSGDSSSGEGVDEGMDRFIPAMIRDWPYESRKIRENQIRWAPELVKKAGLHLDDPYLGPPIPTSEDLEVVRAMSGIRGKFTLEDWEELEYRQ